MAVKHKPFRTMSEHPRATENSAFHTKIDKHINLHATHEHCVKQKHPHQIHNIKIKTLPIHFHSALHT